MKVKLSQKSQDKLNTVHPQLRSVVEAAFEDSPFDVTIIEGVRTLERQKELVAQGASKTLKSYHLKHGDGFSHAVDIAPYPIDWKDTQRFVLLADIIMAKAKELGVRLTWGGDFNHDGHTVGNDNWDLPHYQIEL